MAKLGKGPRSLAVVTLAATTYVAGCAVPDGEVEHVQVCASLDPGAVRLPDEACDRGQPGAMWRTAALPPSPTVAVEDTCYDEDGYPYACTSVLPDTDAGGIGIVPLYGPMVFRGGPAWGYGPPGDDIADNTVRGVSPRGGLLTRSGGGTAGIGAPGVTLTKRSGIVTRTPSPAITRGGLGSSASPSAGSGPRGGTSSGS